jgi:hypothetical protein
MATYLVLNMPEETRCGSLLIDTVLKVCGLGDFATAHILLLAGDEQLFLSIYIAV